MRWWTKLWVRVVYLNVDSESNKPVIRLSMLLAHHQNVVLSTPIVSFVVQLSYLCRRGNYNIISNQVSTLTNFYRWLSNIRTHHRLAQTMNHSVIGNCLLNTFWKHSSTHNSCPLQNWDSKIFTFYTNFFAIALPYSGNFLTKNKTAYRLNKSQVLGKAGKMSRTDQSSYASRHCSHLVLSA